MFSDKAAGVIEVAVTLHTFQFSVFAVGQVLTWRPPVEPQPTAALGFVANVGMKTEVVATPVIVTVAGAVQVLAGIAAVGSVIFTLAITAGVPGMPNAKTAAELVRVDSRFRPRSWQPRQQALCCQ
jgi:hypothetical protein